VPASPRGVPQIEVTFAIDSNGIVSVSARDQATGKAQGLQITPAGGLSGREIERLIREAEENTAADEERRQLRRTRTRLEGLVASNERVFAEFGKLLSSDERERVQETFKRAHQACEAEAEQDINAALSDMQGISKILTQAMLKRSPNPQHA
jgi:molecular chaperone DnaK